MNNKLQDEIMKNKKLEEENRKLKEKLNNQKNINDQLKDENEKLNKELSQLKKSIGNIQIDNTEIKKLKDEINNLQYKLNIKDKEINDLKNNIKDEPKYNFNDVMVIYFRPTDYSFHQGIKCLASDTFAEVEEKLYKKFDDLRNTNNMFTVRALPILRFKKLSENNIHDGDEIQLFKLE